MGFKKAGGLVSKRKWARKSKAQKRYGRTRRISRDKLEPGDRKQSVSFSLPLWQVVWLEQQASRAGVAKSTYLAALIETGKDGLEASELELAEIERDDELTDELEED